MKKDTRIKAPEFELTDQFEHARVFRFPRPKVTVLTIADQKGAAQLASWVQCLRDRYAEQIEIEGVADVSMIPALFHGMFRRLFKKQVTYPVMLDWSGDVIEQFAPAKGVANIYLINREGRILRKFAGAISEAAIRELHREATRAMAADTKPAKQSAP